MKKYPTRLVLLKNYLEKCLKRKTSISAVQEGVFYAINFMDLSKEEPQKHGEGMTDWIDKICGV